MNLRFLQDGSVDLTQIDNEFHLIRFVAGNTGELKTRFLSLEEKPESGAQGQFKAFKQSLASLFFDVDKINETNILDKMLENHDEEMVAFGTYKTLFEEEMIDESMTSAVPNDFADTF